MKLHFRFFRVCSAARATLLLALLVAAPATRADSNPDSAANDRTVVLMLFDGFSPEYIERFPTPALDRMREGGAWTHAMDPAFPTISLTGGVTISTGCWPEHHGIVSNLFIDPERGFYDHASDADWLTGCEHLHQAAERQGLRTAALGWYGRNSESAGPQATYVSTESGFEAYPDDAGRAQEVIEQLERPTDERPRLILAYLKGPDGAGHFAGMDSEETRDAVIAADAAIASVLDAIRALPDADRIQLIVTTDHGMRPVDALVNLDRILRRHDIEARAVSTGTSSFLYFSEPDEATLADAISKLSTYSEFDVVRKTAQPEDWHLGTGPRVGDLIVSAHPPYFIEGPGAWPWFLRWLQYVGPDFVSTSAALKATHGYPTGTPGVAGILYGFGSAFRQDHEVDRIRAVDIHPTLMHVLGLEPGRSADGEVEWELLR